MVTDDQRTRSAMNFKNMRQCLDPLCSSFIFEHCFVWYSLHPEVDLEFCLPVPRWISRCQYVDVSRCTRQASFVHFQEAVAE